VYANRRRTRGARGKRLQRLRSERVERSFAHVCETGGARRTWLCGLDKVRKRYQIAAAAHNLGVLMRSLFGIGTPRGLQAFVNLALALYLAILTLIWRLGIRTLTSAPEPTAPRLIPAAA
jgi:transposase